MLIAETICYYCCRSLWHVHGVGQLKKVCHTTEAALSTGDHHISKQPPRKVLLDSVHGWICICRVLPRYHVSVYTYAD